MYPATKLGVLHLERLTNFGKRAPNDETVSGFRDRHSPADRHLDKAAARRDTPDAAVADLARRYARIFHCPTSLYLVPCTRLSRSTAAARAADTSLVSRPLNATCAAREYGGSRCSPLILWGHILWRPESFVMAEAEQPQPLPLRVFLASPGDVHEERERARREPFHCRIYWSPFAEARRGRLGLEVRQRGYGLASLRRARPRVFADGDLSRRANLW
jgi:hypothetical protein